METHEQLIARFVSCEIDRHFADCARKVKKANLITFSDESVDLIDHDIMLPMKEMFDSGRVSLMEKYADGLNLLVRGAEYYVSWVPTNGLNVWWNENKQWVGYEREMALQESDTDVGHVMTALNSIDPIIDSLLKKEKAELVWFYLRERMSGLGIPMEYLEWAGFR